MTWTALAAFAAMLSVGLAAGAARAAEGNEPLNLGYIPANSIYWDIDAGIEKGFFREEGFAPAVIANQSSPQSIQMIIARSVQMAITQPEPLVAALMHGAKKLAVIGAPGSSPDWFLVTRPDIKSWTDLKGKTLGFSALRVNEFYLVRKLLNEHGVKPNEYNAIQVGPTPAKLAALQKGSIAAGVLFQPTGVLAENQGLRVLYDFAKIKNYPALLYVVNREWAAENQNGVRLARALTKAHHWLYDPKNHDAAIEVIQKYTKRPKNVLDKVYQLYFVTDKLYTRDGAVSAVGLKNVIHDMVANGEITEAQVPSPDSYLLPKAIGGLQE
jgi:ABC-type nitrate/sulfonate/bicarbonate transport system substrate-binding protein